MNTLHSIKPTFFRYTWQFRDLYTDKISSVSCIAFSVEEARSELLSTLKQIENISDEKKKIEAEINSLYRIRMTQSKEEKDVTLDKICKLTRTLRDMLSQVNDYTSNSGIRVNDYSCDLKVIYYHNNAEITTTLSTLISTNEPFIDSAKFVTFT